MIVTIDGPAGAGKSSAARQLAARLGFRFLDTGAMYRAVTLAGLQAGIDLTDQQALLEVARGLKIDLSSDRVQMDGQDVTATIRTLEITTLTCHAADNESVRRLLIEQQRKFAAGRDVVTEGRDQATIVFPNADCKIYLTASDEERARRRFRDLHDRGEEVDLSVVLEKQRKRDQQDAERPFGGLEKAPDSIEVCTDGKGREEVVAELERIVRGKQSDKAK